MKEREHSGFTGSIGFVLAAAGSAVGVGNIWRFPYLAAKHGGGLFLFVYIILVFSFGFTLLTTDIAVGRRTGKNSLEAYRSMDPRWSWLGVVTFVVPALIMTYYPVIGGWVVHYILQFFSGGAQQTAQSDYFTSFITSRYAPLVCNGFFMLITGAVVFRGVEKGVERISRILMPGLLILIVGITLFTFTLKGDERSITDGMKLYMVPDFSNLTFSGFMSLLLDAMSQIFFSLSVSMGIMITYGSYVDKRVNLGRAITQIEVFDTLAAFLSGLMIIPAVYLFAGAEGMASGPALVFISLPKVFSQMGGIGNIVGGVFFLMVAFAALTSCISIFETLVANVTGMTCFKRKPVVLTLFLLYLVLSSIICLGYSDLYAEIRFPDGSTGQLLDLMDYISNSFLMPLISLFSSIFIGWIKKPDWIVQEVESTGQPFGRKKLYAVMIRYVVPVIMAALFFQAL